MKRRWYGVLFGLVLLSLGVTAVCVWRMPDKVPMHYNAAGEIDRYGSRYENLLFPAVVLGIALLFAVMAGMQRRRKAPSNEKGILLAGIFLLVFLNLLFGYFLLSALAVSGGAIEIPESGFVWRLLGAGLGVLFCLLGNWMPKMRRNALFGLRTVWSLKNDRVWQKSQRLGGISMVVSGAAMVLCSIFLTGAACLIALGAILLLDLMLSVVLSYRVYRQDRREHPEDYAV